MLERRLVPNTHNFAFESHILKGNSCLWAQQNHNYVLLVTSICTCSTRYNNCSITGLTCVLTISACHTPYSSLHLEGLLSPRVDELASHDWVCVERGG